MSSTAHWPSTGVHPSMPLVSKSKRSTGMLSGNLISAGAACARACRLRLKAAAAANPALTRPRRDPFGACIATLVQLLGYGLPLAVPDERHVRHWMAIFERRHHAYYTVPLVLFHGLGGGRRKRALGLRHRLALPLRC